MPFVRRKRNVQDHVQVTFDHAILTGTGVRSFLDLETPGTNIDTVVEAIVPGEDGDDLAITFADGSDVDEGEWDESSAPELTFTFKDGVTTVADFEAAIAASEWIQVATAGTALNVLATTDDEFSSENLASGAEVVTRTDKFFKATRKMAVKRIQYINPTGVAADADDYVELSFLKNAVEIAAWSTKTGEEGALTANTILEPTIDGLLAGLAVDDVLAVKFLEVAELTDVPAGRLTVELVYL